MSDDDEETSTEPEELSHKQKLEIAKWFLINSPPGEIQYVAKDVKAVLKDENVYEAAAAEAFPLYNKSHMICLQLPDRSGDVMVTSFSEITEDEYLDPRTAQVAVVNHVKQACTEVRPASDEELPSAYVEEYRCAVDAEISKYVGEAYPKGVCSVYSTKGKHVEEPGSNFELVVVILASRHSPQNFCNGSWRSIWNVVFEDELQIVELRGRMEVGAHYFEEGNVQLDAKHECKDSTAFQGSVETVGLAFGALKVLNDQKNRLFESLSDMYVTYLQSPDDCAASVMNIIRHHETEYLSSLQTSYLNLPDTTFKDLRRKLPVTRTLFPWHNTMQFSLTRDISKELGIGK